MYNNQFSKLIVFKLLKGFDKKNAVFIYQQLCKRVIWCIM